MLKLPQIFLLASLSVLMVSCSPFSRLKHDSSSLNPGGGGGSASQITGYWMITNPSCAYDGTSHYIDSIVRITDTDLSQIVRAYAASNCTGPHTLRDPAGTPVSDFVQLMNSSQYLTITGLPADITVVRTVYIQLSMTIYMIWKRDGTTLYNVMIGTDYGSDWNDWLQDAQVQNFVTDPVNNSGAVYESYAY